MGKYFRKCKGIGEIAVMEVSPVGVRTRARSLALALSSAGKRKRTLSGDFRSRRIPAQARNSPDSVQIPTDRSPSPDPVLTSRCSSNGSSELVQERLRSEHLAGFGNVDFDCRERRETTPSSSLRSEQDELESTTRSSEESLRRKFTAAVMPSAAEIDDFFSAAEKDEKKRFSEKYNFDVEKDVPVEGRYEWVRLK
ncbi:hypothetical protein MRB53_015197 [Persea americana]|uniref:Uncharacterized protein n=1 Tax=Persea americana TaxID=3435 RepID=A0ACC2KDB5_PERAE|nr:hypothetical protein MRB53_015197 [Persea americana]